MKRNIKFRVWDGNRYIIDMSYDLLAIDTHGNVFYAHSDSCESPVSYINEAQTEQYTGLKNTDNKEIYEGDIIIFTMPDEAFWGAMAGTRNLGVVKWGEDQGGFIVEWEYSKNQHHVIFNCDIAIYAVIVGNTHKDHDYQL